MALLGLLGLGIPVYLHMRHRPRAVPFRFPALDFLLQAQKRRQRYVRVEQLFLMILRLLLLTVLAFLFSRPFRESRNTPVTSSGPILFVLDDSASMLAVYENQTCFDQAKMLITDTLKQISPDHEAYLLLASDPALKKELRSAGSILKALPGLKPTTSSFPMDKAYGTALELIESNKLQDPHIEIISDNRKNSWKAVPPEPGSNVQVHLNQLDAIDKNRGFTLIQPLTRGTTKSGFELQVLNSSTDRESVPLTVKSQLKTWQEVLPLSPFSTTAHRFVLDPDASTQVAFNLPDDGFMLDNRQIFPIKTYSEPHILLVDGDPSSVLEQSESFYLKLVLESSGNQDVQLITATGMNTERVNWSDVIILLNVEDPPEDLLSEALAKRKGLLISGGNRVLPEAWNPFLASVGLELWEWNELPEPAVLALPSSESAAGYASEVLKAAEFQIYFGEALVNKAQITTLQGQKMKPILTLQDGSPLLFAGDLNQGRLMFWTSSMDLAGSNIPLQPGFLPLVQSMMDYLFFKEQQIEMEILTITEMKERGEQKFTLTQNWTNLDPSDVSGALPGLYRWVGEDGKARLAAIRIDPEESNFQEFGNTSSQVQEAAVLPKEFTKKKRKDLGQPLAWVFFLMILLETLVSARISEKWGGR